MLTDLELSWIRLEQLSGEVQMKIYGFKEAHIDAALKVVNKSIRHKPNRIKWEMYESRARRIFGFVNLNVEERKRAGYLTTRDFIMQLFAQNPRGKVHIDYYDGTVKFTSIGDFIVRHEELKKILR